MTLDQLRRVSQLSAQLDNLRVTSRRFKRAVALALHETGVSAAEMHAKAPEVVTDDPAISRRVLLSYARERANEILDELQSLGLNVQSARTDFEQDLAKPAED